MRKVASPTPDWRVSILLARVKSSGEQDARPSSQLNALGVGESRLRIKNLIVHRDLKPKNILVTADGVPIFQRIVALNREIANVYDKIGDSAQAEGRRKNAENAVATSRSSTVR